MAKGVGLVKLKEDLEGLRSEGAKKTFIVPAPRFGARKLMHKKRGPEFGQALVDYTVKAKLLAINPSHRLWDATCQSVFPP